MEHILKFHQLNELFKHGKVTEDSHFILFKQDLWIFTDETFSDYEDDIRAKLDFEFDDMDDLFQKILDEHGYVICGDIRDNKAYVNSNLNYRFNQNSIEIIRLKQFLKKPIYFTHSYGAYLDNQDEIKMKPALVELKDQTFYHGTSIKYLKNIMKVGLTNTDHSNFEVKHYDKIFITAQLDKAEFHALTASRKTNTAPVIIELKIPNVDLLDYDYDIVMDYYGYNSEEAKRLGYYPINNYINKDRKTDIQNLHKKFGIYAYLGRIPVSFFTNILFDSKTYKQYSYEDDYSYESEYSQNIQSVFKWRKFKPDTFFQKYYNMEDYWQ